MLQCLCRDCSPASGRNYSCTPRPCFTPHPFTRNAGPGVIGHEVEPLRGRPLRRAAIAVVLRSHGPCTPSQVTRAIETSGYSIANRYPVKAVADAMAYEVGRGWLRRVGKGLYRQGNISSGSRRRILALFS